MTYKAEKAGHIKIWHSDIIPYGWQICDGTNGTPNLVGKSPIGKDSGDVDFDTLGNAGGEKTHQLTLAELAAHTHKTYMVDGSSTYYVADRSTGGKGTQYTTTSSGGDEAHNNLQPYAVTNFIMKL